MNPESRRFLLRKIWVLMGRDEVWLRAFESNCPRRPCEMLDYKLSVSSSRIKGFLQY